jgi:hypothetical protein
LTTSPDSLYNKQHFFERYPEIPGDALSRYDIPGIPHSFSPCPLLRLSLPINQRYDCLQPECHQEGAAQVQN